ncbi:kinase-like domain-containing protein [Fusarium heterosporum]|uniref:EKC/KEOPS complex subunit BUD32 n=1 Tax=Fusarium heterosporum TaxID=42747 RepID=A0A8H5T3S4_FUSHE|nr:kinase-like domain-containing protein [Fusarium heterosporum]
MDTIKPQLRRWDSDFFLNFFPTTTVIRRERSGKKSRCTKGFTRYVISNISEDALYENATRVFREDPTRLFLHGCLSHGTQIEVWVFTRTAIYRSGALDFEQLHFNQLMILYENMCEYTLGASQFVYTSRSGQSRIHVKGWLRIGSYLTDRPRTYSFILDKTPITCPDQITSSQSICHRATDFQQNAVVVKFSQRIDELQTEEKLLRRVTERNLQGVAHLVDSRTFSWSNINTSYVVITPMARSIANYRSIPELLECFRDAIKAHHSLYKWGKILHRDISPGNIMITEPSNMFDRGPRGMLIDFGLSLDLEDEQKAPHSIAGTKMFMAIDVLRNKTDSILPTYRHDLESFFYVFLYIAVCRDRTLPLNSRLLGWVRIENDWAEMGRQKRKDMADSWRFVAIMSEFAREFLHPELVKLAFKLRRLLFYPNGKFFVGTKDEVYMEQLYDSMVSAFEKALSGLSSGSSVPTGQSG